MPSENNRHYCDLKNTQNLNSWILETHVWQWRHLYTGVDRHRPLSHGIWWRKCLIQFIYYHETNFVCFFVTWMNGICDALTCLYVWRYVCVWASHLDERLWICRDEKSSMSKVLSLPIHMSHRKYFTMGHRNHMMGVRNY